jgi:hypothetical protein
VVEKRKSAVGLGITFRHNQHGMQESLVLALACFIAGLYTAFDTNPYLPATHPDSWTLTPTIFTLVLTKCLPIFLLIVLAFKVCLCDSFVMFVMAA